MKEVYIALYGELPLMFSSVMYSNDSFLESVGSYKFSIGVFYGFMLALMLYNLFLFLSFKEKAYLYYALYMLSFMAYQATMNSFDLELVGRFLPDWILYRTLPISCNLLVFFMLLFGKEFLELKKYLPTHNRVLNIFLWLTIFLQLSVFTVPNLVIVNNAITSLTVLVLTFLWVSGLTMLLKGFKMARFYMVGWTVLLGTILIQGFGFLGWIPFHPDLYENLPAIAACFEATFLSLALGDKVNLMKQDMNNKLEEKIQVRTEQLEKANQRLEQLANTDRLTKISNRMSLDTKLDEQLQAAETNGTPLSLILLDIDHFKAVNDQFGHPAGDMVLVETAALLMEFIRETDAVGRWGGEEFMVISPNTGIRKAQELAESLREQIEAHTFGEVGKITASFGVAAYMEGETHKSLLARCDQALYEAKETGRNRVAIHCF